MTLKHTQVLKLWPDLTASAMETMMNDQEELNKFNESMLNREISGKVYVWTGKDAKYSLTLHPN